MYAYLMSAGFRANGSWGSGSDISLYLVSLYLNKQKLRYHD